MIPPGRAWNFAGLTTINGRPELVFSYANASLTYNADRWSGSVKYRWVDSFPWAAGVFVGDVPSYSLVDLGFIYKLNDNWQFGVDVSNLLDKEHWESFGGDLLSRRALANVSFSW